MQYSTCFDGPNVLRIKFGLFSPLACKAPSVAPKPMGVVKVAGDGDCLFHALAFFTCSDGAALRIEVADFMEAHAAEQGGYEDEWLHEVEKLRRNKWGGHTAIAAYTLLKQTRVTVHTMQGVGQRPAVEEMSHGTIYGQQAFPMAHILYNNKDHYDALVEIFDVTNTPPAWPQPPPPMYFLVAGKNEAVEEFPPLGTDNKQAGGKATKNGLAAPRPAKKAKAKAKGKAKTKPAPAKPKRAPGKAKPNPVATCGLDSDMVEDDRAAPATALSLSQSEEMEEDYTKPGLMEELEKIPVATASSHPHRKLEDEIKDGTDALHTPILQSSQK